VLKLSRAVATWAPGAGLRAEEPILLLRAGWDEMVGTEVARNSYPARIIAGTLQVVTRSSAWSHQLSFLAEHVLTAIAARLPRAGIERLRFRVGALPAASKPGTPPRRRAAAHRPAPRAAAASAREAIARFRGEVEGRRRAARAAGWKECTRCGALVAPAAGELCVPCESAGFQERTAATARLLFEAPWLGYGGTVALVEGLKEREYESIRSQLLKRWWEMLAQACAVKRLSRDGRERLIASSYVVLRSKLPPEKIVPATVRTILGDELHDFLYGTPNSVES
jgi:Dna[CI] antecedent, DciA